MWSTYLVVDTRFIDLSGSASVRLSDAAYREPHDKIAVLPFENLGGDPEHEYFADGLAEDLITDLSQTSGLFVIARHSSYAYGGKATDVRSIARSLGVRYVLEGSARRAAGRMRINVQLIHATDGVHLWAERFDRSLDDVFKVQDEVTAKIVEALIGRLKAKQIPERKKPTNLEAYDLCVRGRALCLQSPQAGKEAQLMFEEAIALDPNFAEAHRWLAFSFRCSWRAIRTSPYVSGWRRKHFATTPPANTSLTAIARRDCRNDRNGTLESRPVLMLWTAPHPASECHDVVAVSDHMIRGAIQWAMLSRLASISRSQCSRFTVSMLRV